jgi:hypothetical protein
LSYRRDDASTYAPRLYNSLADRYSKERVFMDIDSLELGMDFEDAINETVARCHVLLALIGRRWLAASDEEGNRRLENPEDLVRLEVEAALARNVRVVPVLVGGAPMPKREQLPGDLVGLTRRNGFRLRTTGWDADVSAMIGRLDRIADSALRPLKKARAKKAPDKKAPAKQTQDKKAPAKKAPAKRRTARPRAAKKARRR